MTPRSPRQPRRSALAAAIALALLAGLAACGSKGEGTGGGADTARGVVAAHVAASQRYDLAATCNLFTPAKRAEMAAFDGTDAEGYCERATRSAVEDAPAATKARSRKLYTDATIAEADRAPGTWFRVTSADGSYHEDVQVVRAEGRWWLGQVESDLDEAGDTGH